MERAGPRPGIARFARDSPLEGNGFELPVPRDLEDFAIGFSYTEGVVTAPAEIAELDIEDQLLGSAGCRAISKILQSALAIPKGLSRRQLK
jgi:hypothetical protein